MKNKRKEERIKRNIKDRTDLILFLLFCVFTLSFTVGYASLNEELNISGEATFRVKEEIRITNVSLSETTNLGLENYSSKYGKDSITLGVDLKQTDSTVTYDVQIVNSGTVSMWIDSINQELNSNANMEFVLEGLSVRELINPGDVKDFKLKIKYKDGITMPSNTTLDTMLRFNFVKPTSTLAQGKVNELATSTFFNEGPITKESVESISFLTNLEVGEDAIGYWDASADKDGTVIAWYTDKDNNGLYELNIGGNGEIYSNKYSSYAFNYFTNVKSIDFNNCFNTSNAVNMTEMFAGDTSLTKLDLSNFNTSNVVSMSNMFSSKEYNKFMALNEIILTSFDTSNVTDMSRMFFCCNLLENLDIQSFNMSNVTNVNTMFYKCSSLKSINTSNWNTSNIKDFGWLFFNCSSLESIDVSNFDTRNATNMNRMFVSCSKITSLNLDNFNTSKVTNMDLMFAGCNLISDLNLSSFDTSSVISMQDMFRDCKSLSSLDLSSFNTSNVTNMSKLFSGCNLLENLNIDGFNTASVTDMSYMFSGCSNLTSLDVSNFDTSNVTNMASMFNGCSNLVADYELKPTGAVYTFDISNFDTSNVTNMSYMFSGCTNFKAADFTNFDTTNVTDMSNMFLSCRNLTFDSISGGTLGSDFYMVFSLDLSGFNTPNLTNVSGMFCGCTSLTSIGLNSMKFDNVTNFEKMFYSTPKLESIVVGTSYVSTVEEIVSQSGSSAQVSGLDI